MKKTLGAVLPWVVVAAAVYWAWSHDDYMASRRDLTVVRPVAPAVRATETRSPTTRCEHLVEGDVGRHWFETVGCVTY